MKMYAAKEQKVRHDEKLWANTVYFPIKIGHDDRIISFRLLFIFKIKQWRPLQ
jgi:hypothetical protein